VMPGAVIFQQVDRDRGYRVVELLRPEDVQKARLIAIRYVGEPVTDIGTSNTSAGSANELAIDRNPDRLQALRADCSASDMVGASLVDAERHIARLARPLDRRKTCRGFGMRPLYASGIECREALFCPGQSRQLDDCVLQ
jgi:hypothetical protein